MDQPKPGTRAVNPVAADINGKTVTAAQPATASDQTAPAMSQRPAHDIGSWSDDRFIATQIRAAEKAQAEEQVRLDDLVIPNLPKATRDALLRELAAKQAEIGKEQPLEAVLLELIREAAEIWSRLSEAIFMLNICDPAEVKISFLYANRALWMPDHDRRRAMKFARIAEQFETCVIGAGIRELAHLAHGSARKRFGSRKRRLVDIPSPAEVRRLRIVTEELPRWVCPTGKGRIKKSQLQQWRMLWRFGLGMKATAIANGLRARRKNGQSRRAESNATMYRGRKAALGELASLLKPDLERMSAA